MWNFNLSKLRQMMKVGLRIRCTLAVAGIIPLLTLPASVMTSTSTSESTSTITTPSTTEPPDISGAVMVTLHEDTRLETDLGAVTCYDKSLGSAPDSRCLTCNILSVSPGFRGFAMWKRHGNQDFHLYYVPYLPNTGLSHTSTSSYSVMVICNGQNQVSGTWTTRVDVLQNQPPVFTVYPTDAITLEANSTAAHTTVYTATATDAENDTLTYSMEVLPNTGIFVIRANDGTISPSRDLTTANISFVVVHVLVRDVRSTVGPFILNVTLTNLNSKPTCSNFPTSLNIREDAPPGQPIMTLTCTDPDSHDTLVTEMTINPPSEALKFELDSNGMNLSLAHAPPGTHLLDAESIASYRICFRVTDGFLDLSDLCVTLTVTNVNENPSCASSAYSCVLYEVKSSLTSNYCNLGNVRFEDPENDVISRISLLPSTYSSYFSWESDRSTLTLSGHYDIDDTTKSTSLTLELLGEDFAGGSSTCTVAVTVLDTNDNTPESVGTYIYSVTAGITQVPSVLGTITAVDKDLTSPNNVVTLKVKGMAPPEGNNYILFHNGDIIYYRYADVFIVGQTILLTVEAKDGGVPAKSTDVFIYISVNAAPSLTTQTTDTTTPTTTTTRVTSSPGAGQSLLSSEAGITVFAAAVAVAVLTVMLGAFFLVRYICTSSIPGHTSTGYSPNINNFGNSRVSPYNSEHQQPRHHQSHQRNLNYDSSYKTDSIHWHSDANQRRPY
ncbi:protocadherin Fat 3-like [Haliotis rufescens]|uniref:protocadherin Fat 3-like n=1 Tax=Haliotis rufescens TaxID=6454 RepID=UPI00201EB808|nr:protocadherin Fat 3-like [Haliotis rufescens]